MRIPTAFVLASLLAGAAAARAEVVAYYRFEEGLADMEFPYPVSPGGPGSGITVDSAGGDDGMRTWADFTNPVYRADVPAPVIPRTGAPNTLSTQFAPNEDFYSEAAPINNRLFNQFTIEASVKFNHLNGWQTFVGKDGWAFPGSINPALSSLYFQLVDPADANQDKVAIKAHDSNGTFVEVFTQQPVVAGQWYNFAAIMDGTTLSLYREENGTYILEDTKPFSGAMALQDRLWSIGRGMYNNGPTDWINGFVDEVRISDTALPTSQLLFAVPEPGMATMIISGFLAWAMARRADKRGGNSVALRSSRQ